MQYTKNEKTEIIRKYKVSGKSKIDFSKELGISPVTLRTWIREEEKAEEIVQFIEAKVNNEIYENNISIKFKDFIIVFDENTSENLLAKALNVVKNLC